MGDDDDDDEDDGDADDDDDDDGDGDDADDDCFQPHAWDLGTRFQVSGFGGVGSGWAVSVKGKSVSPPGSDPILLFPRRGSHKLVDLSL